MSNVQITNGTVKYGRTVKTGDFESKRGDVELSFTVAEGVNPDEAITVVEGMAIRHVFDILGVKEDNRPAAPAPAKAETAKPAKAAKIPAKAASPHVAEEAALAADLAANAASVEDPAQKPAILQTPEERAAIQNKKAAADAATVSEDDELGDLLGTDTVKEITDKELTDAVQKCQAANKNAPAIRKVISELAGPPPKRVIDVPQDKRQKFIDELLKIKPLA